MLTRTSSWAVGALIVSSLFCSVAACAGDLKVTISGLSSSEGKLMVAVFNVAANFPQGKPLQGQMVAATKGDMSVVFKDLAPGRYAVSAFHDVNGNGRLDANMMGMPTEPYGFSRDAKGSFGPPKFDDAAFTQSAESQQIVLRVQ
jgi:uncharacterized protein (DUF2141 family)